MAQGNYGTSDNPLEEIHGEQLVYEPLTSDPSDREEGAVWFRADMDSGDKVGTFRIQNDDDGNDIDDWPAFAEADSVDGVVKVLPVQTQNGEAFRPYIEEGGALDQHRLQHNGTWYGAHSSLAAIPDSGLTHRNPMDEGSGSTAADSVGSNDLTLSGPTWQSGAGNGENYLEFDETNDTADYDSVPFTGSANRTFGAWVNINDLAGNEYVTDIGASGTGERWSVRFDGSDLRIELEGDGYTSNLSPTSGDWKPIACVLDGTTLGDHLLYVDGSTEQSSGTLSVNTGNVSSGIGYRATGSPSGTYFGGGIDDPIWWNRALSANELDQWVSATEGNYP